jgi:hypothetical protein
MDHEGPTIAWYLVAFVDVLGQRKSLSEMTALPCESDLGQMDEFKSRLRATAGKVLTLRQTFDALFERASREPDLGDLSDEQQCLYKTFTSNPLKSHVFSDFLVLSLCLHDDMNRVPMRGVYSALYAAAASFVTMLAGGTAIRGGVDVGLGLELPEGDVYGPALARAHVLESRVAQYPRIVIGEELRKYIEVQKQRPETDVFSTLNRKMAELCEGLLRVDDDGYPFLDYLSEGFPLVGSVRGEEIIRDAYKFIVDQSIRHQKEKDSKLAFRYSLLRDYFEHRLGPERAASWIE